MSLAGCRVGILSTHPIQYYTPWYRALAQAVELRVFYCHQQSATEQAQAGFGVPFTWDIPLLEGYTSEFLPNQARHPNVNRFGGCDTPEIARRIRAHHFDAFIVHGWYVKSYWQAMIACWQSGTPLLVRGDSHLATPRSRLKQRVKDQVYRAFLSRFDGYLAVGQMTRAYYLHYGADPRRIFFAPHAVDNDFFACRADALRSQRAALRDRWGLPEDAVVFAAVGKLIARKRPWDILCAIEAAAPRAPRLWGLMVGDGPLRAEIETAARARHLPIAFTGFLNQTELPEAYVASDCLLLASDDDTWGLVINEGMASGLPALVSDVVGCAPDLVLPEQTGQQFPCGSVRALASQLARLGCTPETLAAWGKQAHQHIARYSLDAAVTGTLRALTYVTTHRRPSHRLERRDTRSADR